MVTYLVDKTSCKRFLKSLKNHVRFEFFSVFLTKHTSLLLFNLHAGNGDHPVSESAHFQKQIQIFNAILKKRKFQNK